MKTNTNIYFTVLCIALLAFISWGCSEEEESINQPVWEQEVDQVKAATVQYQDFSKADTEGFIDVSDYVPQMGHHYLLPARVDDKFELEKPEILLYAPDANGNMEFLGVEYTIMVDDPNNPGAPPEGFTGDLDEWHFREDLGQWQLHVWTIKDNPDGIFARFNPNVTN
ncbi:MAG: hypothetical protein ACFB15_23015 [Cyclobacteriaceae bacterium]